MVRRLNSINFEEQKDLDLTDLALSKGDPVLFINDDMELPIGPLLF